MGARWEEAQKKTDTPGENWHPPPAGAAGAGSNSYQEGSGAGRSHGGQTGYSPFTI
jgi:hypothetical protein